MKMKKLSYKVSIIQLQYFVIVCIAVLRSMQFHVEIGDNMDLIRHFYMMKLVKNSGYSLLEYVFLYGNAFTTNITLRFSYAFNLIVYIIAKYTDNYYIMVWFFTLVDYSIIAYIGIDWWKKQGGRKGFVFLFEILLCFSLMPFIHVVSGLRAATAACIMALALYMYIYRNCRMKIFGALILISAMFHPAFITALPFAILAKKVKPQKGLIISIVGCASVFTIANLFLRSSNSFLYSIASKYLEYTGDEGYTGTRFCYYGVIVICILTLINYFHVFFYVNIGIKLQLFSVKEQK